MRLAAQFGITALLTRRFKYLSTGETRKTLLCRALMPEPDLLILDEPFGGLDVHSRAQLAALLSELSAGVKPWCWCSTGSTKYRILCGRWACWRTAP